MIKAKNLIKIYDNRNIINNITFDISEGEFVGVIGESGAGKSTLLYLIGGIIKPDGGEIVVGNNIISSFNDNDLSKWRKNNISFVFQNNNLIPQLSVKDNLDIALSIQQNSLKFDNEKILSTLEEVGMRDSYYKIVGTLSGGQQQRIAIARSLISNNKILLTDEPTGSLDSANAEAILNLFKIANKKYNKTIIMVTHSKKQLVNCTKILEIRDGMLYK